jgi:hypothetical protein
MNNLKKFDKVIAIDRRTKKARPDLGSLANPRIFTVEVVNLNTCRLFQVGSYEKPLYFDCESGLPLLNEHSNQSLLYKNWKNFYLRKLTDATN